MFQPPTRKPKEVPLVGIGQGWKTQSGASEGVRLGTGKMTSKLHVQGLGTQGRAAGLPPQRPGEAWAAAWGPHGLQTSTGLPSRQAGRLACQRPPGMAGGGALALC